MSLNQANVITKSVSFCYNHCDRMERFQGRSLWSRSEKRRSLDCAGRMPGSKGVNPLAMGFFKGGNKGIL